MFRVVHTSNSLPASFIADPSAEFVPGMVGQLTVIGNQVMCTVSDGLAPLGIIDEIKTRSFTAVSWNETIIVPATGVPSGPNYISTVDIKAELKKPNISESSFTSTVPVVLNPINGVITFVAGTVLNYNLLGGPNPDSIKTIVNYTYNIANVPGDDSTLGSGRMTIWYSRMFVQTDQFETTAQYPVRQNLFVNEQGLFTTRKPSSFHPAVGMVTAPPTTASPYLELLWL